MEFKDYLNIMALKDGSDLYLTTDAKASIRCQGKILPIEDKPLPPGRTKQIAYELMDESQRKEFAETFEMNLAFATEKCRYRVNIFQQRGEVGIVIRTIQIDIPKMEDLRLPAKVLQDLIMQKRGLILFVGATSSGKSTSLASLIDYRNRNSASHIITIEDPMEFVHEHRQCIIEQREVGFDTQSYGNALKNTLRQAPDVILIGEIRSAETMDYAMAFAETGHLCLSTLHANNANQAIDRILSFFPQDHHPRLLLELSLNIQGIVSQRLIPTLTGKRVPAVEVLLASPLIKELIKKGELSQIKEVMDKSELSGMQTFDSALFKLYREGIISYEDAIANSDSANNLRLKIKLAEDTGGDGDGEQTEKSDDKGKKDAPPTKSSKLSGAFNLEKSEDDEKDTGAQFFR